VCCQEGFTPTPVRKNKRTYTDELPETYRELDDKESIALFKEAFGTSVKMGDDNEQRYRGAGIMLKELPPLLFGTRRYSYTDATNRDRRHFKELNLAISITVTQNADKLHMLPEMLPQEGLPIPSIIVANEYGFGSIVYLLGQAADSKTLKCLYEATQSSLSLVSDWYGLQVGNDIQEGLKRLKTLQCLQILNPCLPDTKAWTSDIRYNTQWLTDTFADFAEVHRPNRQLTLF
jgi:hypothetical protein